MARPRQFDEEKVLTAAGDAFWAKGYEATSTRDLTDCTGLTQSSIYAAFGDKRGIFLRSFDHYLDRTLRERITRLETTKSPGEAIVGFFEEIVDRSLSDTRHRGCLLVNTALEATPDDPELLDLVADETVMVEKFFERCVIAGQATGEIVTDQPAEDHAQHLLAAMLGLRVLARVRPDAELFAGMMRPVLSTLGLHWPPGHA